MSRSCCLPTPATGMEEENGKVIQSRSVIDDEKRTLMTGIDRIGAALSVLCLVLSDPVCAQSSNLTGVWHTTDGATFYVRQVGTEIWGFGQQAPINARWTN